ncbi:MAG: GDP-mannose 4,6-dehydratase, partial [Anaerolineales bacterium]|nr:GDP-mannose 4,6-dehydratase [Anaerolineales bacterium]
IGSNCVARLLQRGAQVTVYDNLSRAGAAKNLAWLRHSYGPDSFRLVVGDLRDAALLTATARSVDIIIHLAGQVAVTTSVLQPREDYEINATGTFNVLEAARLSGRYPLVLYASTNKVYGGMEDVGVAEGATRYEYADQPFGMSETYPLDFHSPYGCSKGAGDQYVRDYARIYGLPTVVFRQSTIYGPRQFGIEDQGWMAWFMIAAVLGKPIRIYGNGKQIRDMLFVDDLLDAYEAAIERRERVAGQVFNIGGGPGNTISVWAEFGPALEALLGRPIPVGRGEWRPGDQKVFVADIRKAARMLDWQPKTDLATGMQKLLDWIVENRALFE